jgi:hypothetical protein
VTRDLLECQQHEEYGARGDEKEEEEEYEDEDDDDGSW